MRGSRFFVLPICGILTACQQSSPGETSGSEGTPTSTEPTSEPTTTSDPPDCGSFNSDPPGSDVAIVLRNSRDSEIFLVAGPCGQLPLQVRDPLTNHTSRNEMCLEKPCVEQFCPQSCAPISPFLVAPGGLGPPLRWDGRLLVHEEMPLACIPGPGNDQGTVQCESLTIASPGELEVSVFFAAQVTGCNPEPCACVPNDEGWCQVFPEMAATVGNDVAVGILEFPAQTMLEVVTP